MLIYLGVGLAVTTMCIDLVGIQYIQKIHYFGRKFRGTDLLQLLKRKRMIERRLAMGQGEEIIEKYIQHIQDQEKKKYVLVVRSSVLYARVNEEIKLAKSTSGASCATAN